MSKSIKVKEEVYNMLLEIQRPRETFTQLIARLLLMNELLTKIEPIIRGQHQFYEEKVRKANEAKAALAQGNSP